MEQWNRGYNHRLSFMRIIICYRHIRCIVEIKIFFLMGVIFILITNIYHFIGLKKKKNIYLLNILENSKFSSRRKFVKCMCTYEGIGD